MMPDKKFFADHVALYPLDRDIFKRWFIKYYTPDFAKGELVKKKYFGNLHKIHDRSARLAEAERIMQAMASGIAPPNCQGARHLTSSAPPRNFSPIAMMQAVIESKRHEWKPGTFKSYKAHLRGLQRWLHNTGKGNLTFLKIDAGVVKAFFYFLKAERHLSNRTYNAYKIALSLLWKESIGGDGVNPFRSVRALPKVSVPFRALPDVIEKNVLANLPTYDAQLWIALQMVYYSCIRVTEAAQLRLHNILWGTQEFQITADISKSKRTEKVLIPDVLFKQFLELRYHEMDTEFFLLSKNGMPGPVPLGYNNLRNRWNAFRLAFGISKVYKLYGLKHTSNSKMAAMGVNAKMLQQHNRHHSLDYTQHYLSGFSASDMDFLKKKFPRLGEKVKMVSNEDELQEVKAMLRKLLERP